MAGKENEEKKNNEETKWLNYAKKKRNTMYEMMLIDDKKLVFERSNRKFVIFSGSLSCNSNNDTNDQENEKNGKNGKKEFENSHLWYRHMSKAQFDHLLKTNTISMVDKKAYVAITTSHDYCLKYLNGIKRNGHINSHIVEFIVKDESTDLDKIFKAIGKEQLGIANLQPKIEDGALTWGLGPQCRKGLLGITFNQLLKQGQIEWRLVNFKLPIGHDK